MTAPYGPAMEPTDVAKPKGGSGKKGCLIFVLGTLALVFWVFWQIGEPGRRAQVVRESIRPGMNAIEVEPLLIGRHYFLYQVQRPDGWENVTRDAFQQFVSSPPAGEPVKLRLALTFMGMSPGRITFHVEVGPDGRVVKIDQPRNWD